MYLLCLIWRLTVSIYSVITLPYIMEADCQRHTSIYIVYLLCLISCRLTVSIYSVFTLPYIMEADCQWHTSIYIVYLLCLISWSADCPWHTSIYIVYLLCLISWSADCQWHTVPFKPCLPHIMGADCQQHKVQSNPGYVIQAVSARCQYVQSRVGRVCVCACETYMHGAITCSLV